MKIVFMGTPAFSVPVLEKLHQHHEIIAVYCQPPRAAGRGKSERPTPVHARAEALGLPVFHPTSLRSEAAASEFAALRPDVAVVVAYGLILPQALLAVPLCGCLNIHASLLPRWRGAAPIHRAIMAGDAETGVCIMQMEAGLDTGPVLAREVVAIGPEETTDTLHDRLSLVGRDLVIKVLDRLPLPAMAQPSEGITYADKIDKAEARIDWSRPAPDIDRQIRGLSRYPGAWCEVSGERVKLLGSRLAEGHGAPGQVLHGFTVACGVGAVEITLVQREGKAAMTPADLLRGFVLPAVLG